MLCLLLFTNMSLKFEHESDGISTWSKFDGRIPTSIILLCAEICIFPL